jgi:hypothetical protein
MWDLLIVVLVLSPVDPSVPHRVPEPLWQALKRVALAMEVVGPHERWIEDFRSELGYVRRHSRELAGAPPLDDCLWMPPACVIRECRTLNLGYQQCLDMRRQVALHRQDELTEALAEARSLAEVWCLVEAASCSSKSWVCRRRALQRLQEVLGPDAYYNGQLPPCVPLWRFEVCER